MSAIVYREPQVPCHLESSMLDVFKGLQSKLQQARSSVREKR